MTSFRVWRSWNLLVNDPEFHQENLRDYVIIIAITKICPHDSNITKRSWSSISWLSLFSWNSLQNSRDHEQNSWNDLLVLIIMTQLVILTHTHDHEIPSSWTLLILMITKVIFVIVKACKIWLFVIWKIAFGREIEPFPISTGKWNHFPKRLKASPEAGPSRARSGLTRTEGHTIWGHTPNNEMLTLFVWRPHTTPDFCGSECFNVCANRICGR